MTINYSQIVVRSAFVSIHVDTYYALCSEVTIFSGAVILAKMKFEDPLNTEDQGYIHAKIAKFPEWGCKCPTPDTIRMMVGRLDGIAQILYRKRYTGDSKDYNPPKPIWKDGFELK